jgi:hypothetical protein
VHGPKRTLQKWDFSEDCLADFIVLVDLDRNKLWLFPIFDFRKDAPKAGKLNRRLRRCPPGYEYQKQHRHESDFAYYEMDNGILNAFKKSKVIGPNTEQVSNHDGSLGFIRALKQQTKGKVSVDVRWDVQCL